MKNPGMFSPLAGFERYLPKQGTLDGFERGFATGNATYDAAVSGGMVFLTSELEKQDPRLIKPISTVTFPRDMPIDVGGGWLSYTSNVFSNYGTSGPNLFGIQANSNSNIARAQVDISKDLFPLYAWQSSVSIKFIDMKKLENTPRSIMQIYDESVLNNWNLAQNEMAYYGLVKAGEPVYGLVNDPAVTITVAAATGAQNGATNSTLWVNKTPQQIINDFSAFLYTQWALVQYAPGAMINQVLIPPMQYSYLNSTILTATSAGTTGIIGETILSFILRQNIAKNQGIDLKIFPCRQCIGAGTGGTDRMVGYLFDETRLYMPITVPMTQAMAVPNILQSGGSYETLYAAQLGAPKKLLTQGFSYEDGI